MEFYMVPIEGLTGYIYRNVYHARFRPMDRYFTPFISPGAQGGMEGGLSSREINDILPKHNRGLCVMPQILTDRIEDFLRAALTLKEHGCREVNLNLEYPSSTVASKNKEAGFLSMPHALDMFLEIVMGELGKVGMEMSVKTRLGIYSSDEFYHLLEIYNRYPLTQLIIHSGARMGYYKNTPGREMFGYGLEHGSSPVCYNGDLFATGDFRGPTQQYPKLEHVTIGRGIIANPGPMEAIETGTPLDKVRLEEFHQWIYEGYRRIMFGDRNMLFKMKKIWASMIRISSNDGKYGKKIRKARWLGGYEAAVSQVFRDLDIVEGIGLKSHQIGIYIILQSMSGGDIQAHFGELCTYSGRLCAYSRKFRTRSGKTAPRCKDQA